MKTTTISVRGVLLDVEHDGTVINEVRVLHPQDDISPLLSEGRRQQIYAALERKGVLRGRRVTA